MWRKAKDSTLWPNYARLKARTPGGVFALDRESAVLGRHPECDIVLDSGAVSRQHARIQRVDDKFYIEDMQSRNGTYVNGRQIRERLPAQRSGPHHALRRRHGFP